MIRESVSAVTQGRRISSAYVAFVSRLPVGFKRDVYALMEWLGLRLPEHFGGLGFGMREYWHRNSVPDSSPNL